MEAASTAYPFPPLARLALALYASRRRVERLPVVRTWEPHELVTLVATAPTYREGDYL